MIFDYGRCKALLITVGVVALPLSLPVYGVKNIAISSVPSKQTPIAATPDSRVVRLRTFLSRLHCPVATLSEDFVRVADENKLDWRLLPSIAVLESGGGKVYKNNNVFGWNSGRQAFASIREGLEEVANKLGNSRLYRNRDSIGKLHVYNANDEYASSVLELMDRMGPRLQTAWVH